MSVHNGSNVMFRFVMTILKIRHAQPAVLNKRLQQRQQLQQQPQLLQWFSVIHRQSLTLNIAIPFPMVMPISMSMIIVITIMEVRKLQLEQLLRCLEHALLIITVLVLVIPMEFVFPTAVVPITKPWLVSHHGVIGWALMICFWMLLLLKMGTSHL